MPHYKLHIKLDGQELREFTILDPRIDTDLVYLDYKKRVNAKNGTGGVIYFDLGMERKLACPTRRTVMRFLSRRIILE